MVKRYGIRLPDKSWLMVFGETENNSRVKLSFKSREEAEDYADNLELKNVDIEEIND